MRKVIKFLYYLQRKKFSLSAFLPSKISYLIITISAYALDTEKTRFLFLVLRNQYNLFVNHVRKFLCRIREVLAE